MDKVSRRTVWLVILVFCTLFWSSILLACDASRYNAYLTEGVMAGEECQQFIRKFGQDMWNGEACEAMKDQLSRAKREQNRLMAEQCVDFTRLPSQDIVQRKTWLAQHLMDVGHNDLRQDAKKFSFWIESY